jgi:hypothetical protein
MYINHIMQGVQGNLKNPQGKGFVIHIGAND